MAGCQMQKNRCSPRPKKLTVQNGGKIASRQSNTHVNTNGKKCHRVSFSPEVKTKEKETTGRVRE